VHLFHERRHSGRRLIVAATAVLALAMTIAAQPASADDPAPIPVDQPPVLSHDADGESTAMVVSAGRAPARADGVQFVGGCQFEPQYIPNSADFVLEVTANASATGLVTAYGSPAATGVTCEVSYVDLVRPPVVVSRAAPGTTVVGGTTVQGRASRLKICMSMSALFSSGTMVRTETACLTDPAFVRQSLVEG